MALRWSDALIGAAIGGLGASNGVALPASVGMGLGYDLTVMGLYHLRPEWFPAASRPPALEDTLYTAAGVAAGWALVHWLVAHNTNPRTAAGIAIAGSLVAGMAGGRSPGSLRRA